MQIISAALAFAITMLVLSMVVSTLVETIHRILGMRERGLYYMLGELFDHVLQHYIPPPPAPPPADAPAIAQRKRAFQDQMSENRGPVAATAPAGPARTAARPLAWGPPLEWNPTRILQWLRILLRNVWLLTVDVWRGRGLSTLTAAGFMERLGGRQLGEDIVNKAEASGTAKANAAAQAGPAPNAPPPAPLPAAVADLVKKEVDAVLQDVAQKFDAFSQEASVFFERRARLLSVLVAFGVAFALNVNAFDIFRTFVRDPALTEAVIARLDDETKAFQASAAEAEKRVSHPPAAPSGAALAAFQQTANDVANLKKEYLDAKAKLESTKTQLSGLGVPIGWNDDRKTAAAFKPQRPQNTCKPPGKQPYDVKGTEPCKPDETPGTRTVFGIFGIFGIPTDWGALLGVLLGGLLVGLGGPFWFDMIKNLTSIRDIARAVQGTPAPTTPTGAAAPAPAGVGGTRETPQPRTPVDIFKAARAGWIAAGRPTPG